jgi:hypothetical protein
MDVGIVLECWSAEIRRINPENRVKFDATPLYHDGRKLFSGDAVGH